MSSRRGGATRDVLAAGLLTQPSSLVATALPIDRTLYVRVGSRVGGIERGGTNVPFNVAP
jgi:hypothetical protein